MDRSASVPLFYFDYACLEHSSSDDVGTELPNIEAAKAEAVGAAADWLKDNATQFIELRLSVRDGEIAPLFVVTARIETNDLG
jgi:hypothetical protein